jgi:response regulator RpfG family c-di-GMP phosphodiesterase
MPNDHPIVVVLEDCPVTGMLVERAILNDLSACRVLWARSVDDAKRRIDGLPVDLFIVDIGLPDGSGLDFLWSATETHPAAKAIVITATGLPEYQANSAALGVLHFLEKPLNHKQMVGLVEKALDAETLNGTDTEFRATLENVTPVDILQLKCLTGSTTVVEFRSSGKMGRVRFQSGEIVDAEAPNLRGPEAVFEIIQWKRGQVSELPCHGFVERTIGCSWQTLLMEAAQRLDEKFAEQGSN